jgi:hypothetical protein
MSERERLVARVRLDPQSSCWAWSGHIDRFGYGKVGFRGGHWLAHRAVYTAVIGDIPDGLTLDHTCRNRSCVNPAHLEPVTRRENTLRGIGPAAQNARKTHCPHGHSYDEKNTRLGPDKKRYCRSCNREAASRARRATRW